MRTPQTRPAAGDPPREAASPPALAVIIPTLNEAQGLPALLTQLQRQRGIALELIVADGGSTDATPALAREAGARLVTTPPGRGRQMNRAAAAAAAPLLLFLHADSSLPAPHLLAQAVQALQRQWQQAGHRRLAGHFRLRFLRSRPGHDLVYRYYEEKSALNRAECTNGDQGFLLAAEFFRELGGFDTSQGFLEDQRLAEQIRRQGQWITLPGELGTSARRFESEGLGRRLLLSALIMNRHAIDQPAFFQRAANLYLVQAETGRLCLGPVFELIAELDREAGLRGSLRNWYASGRHLATHLWQPCLFLDLWLQRLSGRDRRWLLALHDRLLSPLCRLRLVHLLLAVPAWSGFVLGRLLFRQLDR